ncbi:MAG: AAA domain-containing protein [Fluviicola sp.]
MQVVDAKQVIDQFLLDLSAIPTSDALVNLANHQLSLRLEALPSAAFRQPLENSLIKLLKEAQSTIRESDINPLTLAIGTFSTEIANQSIAAPVLLVPISWRKVGLSDVIELEPDFERIVYNPYLNHVFREQGALPDLEGKKPEELLEQFQRYLEKHEIQGALATSFLIGNFHFARFQFLRELDGILKQEFSPLLRQFLGDESVETSSLPKSKVQLTPLDADQRRVLDAFHENNCVIQGPPGTGKSQVLTSLIGRCMDLDLSTLVLSEKPVALAVLKKKLAAHGLDDHIAVVHANYSSRDFLVELRQTWEKCEAYIADKPVFLPLSTMRLQSLQMTLDRLNQRDLLGGVSLHEFRELAHQTDWQQAPFVSNVPDLVAWKEQQPILERLRTILPHIQGFKRAFFLGEKPDVILDNHIKSLSRFEPWLQFGSWLELKNLEEGLHLCQLAENEQFERFLQLLDKPREKKRFEKVIQSYRIKRIELEKAQFELNVWKVVPTKTQIDHWQEAQGYWNKKRSRKQLQAQLIDLTIPLERCVERWQEWYAIQQEIFELETQLLEFGLAPGYAQVESSMLFFQELQKHNHSRLQEVIAWGSEKRQFLLTQQQELKLLRSQLKSQFYWNDDTHIADLLHEKRTIIEPLVADWKEIREMPEWVFQFVHVAADYDELKAIVLKGNYNNTLALFPELLQATGEKMKDRIAHIIEDEDAEIAHFGALLRSSIHERFAEYTRLLRMVPAKLSAEKRELRARLKKGKALLVKEFGKSRSHISIRELLESDAAPWIRVLFPCWFTTPVQLADHLPLEPEMFDVLIVDEASQMPVPAVLGAMQRAKRVVIAGDEQQMAPSQFFGKVISSLDVLHQGSFYFEKCPLNHHYRSKQTALIAFSNRHFYNGQLVVYPSATVEQAVFDHFISDGIFDERTNEREAKAVASWLKQADISKSLGIVAFSKDQLQAILKACDPATLQKIQEGEEQGVVFVKTLENVQGDEAQLVVVSMGYAKNTEGKFPLRFGPLNQVNGFKRLNVLLTRAQEQLHFFSSVRADDFSMSSNEGVHLLKQWIAVLDKDLQHPVLEFPHHVSAEPEGNHLTIREIESAIPNAEDLVIFQRVMSERGWNLRYR